ncbi:MAG: MBL fold metallo-hydrolase [Anaerolineae bacterium]|nr:MBL fold metallo-hydrolase [Anaerolineae bacterium]
MNEALLQPTAFSPVVYSLAAEGGNVGLCVGKEGVLVVDIPRTSEVARVRDALGRLSPGPLRFLANTHVHGDHVAGNAELGKQMLVIAHANVRKRMMSEQRITVGFSATNPAYPPEAWPRLIFDQSLTLYLNDEEIRLVHFPQGHSDSDVVVWFCKANVAHLGDIFWSPMFPFVDVENGGSVAGLIRNVERLLDLLPPATRLIPGHGVMSDMDGLRAYYRMLVETSEWICAQRRAGHGAAEIVQSMPEEWQHWGRQFISVSIWVDLVLYSYGLSEEKA